MKLGKTQLVLALILAGLAGCIGAFAAAGWSHSSAERGLHGFVHNELSLTASQESKLEEVEGRFAAERKELELDSRAANARLAQAMDQEHEYGPEVSAAIDEVHMAMGEMQKATVRHVFEMREILDPAQQREFDRQVSDALTRNSPE